MFERMTLAQTGAVVALLPVLLQIVIVASVASVLFQEQIEAQAESQSRDIMAQVQTMEKETAEFVVATILYAESRGIVGRNLTENTLKKIGVKFETVEKSLSNTSEVGALQRCRAIIERIREKCAVVMDINIMTSAEEIADLELSLAQEGYSLITEATQLIEHEKKITQQKEESNRHWRGVIRVAMITSLVVSVILTAFVARMHFVSLVQKIQLLASNAQCLWRRKPLNPTLPGSGELAQFDQELHEIDRQLAEAMEREKDSFENAAQLIFSLDGEFRFARVNAMAHKLLGVQPEEMIGQPAVNFLSPQSKQTTQQALLNVKQGKTTSFKTEVSAANGSSVVLLWSCYWSEREHLMYCTTLDVTEREQIDQLKRNFTSMLRDRLSNPLEEVKAAVALSLKQEQDQLSKDAITDLHMAEVNLTRLIALVQNLTDADAVQQKAPELDIKPVSMAAVIEASKHSVLALCTAKKVTIEVNANSAAPVQGDFDKLVRVVTNLVGNAIKFSPALSTVTISVETVGTQLRVSVSDKGPGIPLEFQDKIFKPFIQAPNQPKSVKGTGLGLAICETIITAHGGTIGVTSELDKGSTFWFTLPL